MEKAHDLSLEKRTTDISLDEDIKFGDMLLSESTLAGLEGAGFRKPSPIQKKAIPLGRCGFDLIVQAKSGTGKTCVFAVIAMEMLVPTLEKLQIVILAPTREISVQISNVISTLTKKTTKPKIECFIGGFPLEQDKKKLSKCQIAVGAPGRMKHLITSGLMDLESVRLFVLDEADRLMEENFRKDISYIYSKMPYNKQVIAVSATFPNELEKFVSELMKKPVKVSPGKETVLLGVRQFATTVPSHPSVLVQMKTKTKELINILSSIPFKQCLVFSNYQSRAESICYDLTENGWPAIYINSSQTQVKRLKAFSSLKEYRCRVLLSTDLTSRGIDAENVNLVVNLDLPYDAATYLHRIGRAGRYGTQGVALTILQTGEEVERFRNLLHEIGGDNFRVSLFPQEKTNFDVWTDDVDSFDKLSSLSGEYKFMKKAEDPEDAEKATVDGGNEEAASVVHHIRLRPPEKLPVSDLEILTGELTNFGKDIADSEMCHDRVFDSTLSDKVESSLVYLEKIGWKSFHRGLETSRNVKNSKTICEQNLPIKVSSCSGGGGGEEEEEEEEEEGESTNESEYSTSLSLSEDDENCENWCRGKGSSQTYFSSNMSKWYGMWFQQTALIRHYVQFYHYWKKADNFN